MCGNRDDVLRSLELKTMRKNVVAALANAMVYGCQAVVPAGIEGCLIRFNEELSRSPLSYGDGALVPFEGNMLEVQNAVREALEAVPEIQEAMNDEDSHQVGAHLCMDELGQSAGNEQLIEMVIELLEHDACVDALPC